MFVNNFSNLPSFLLILLSSNSIMLFLNFSFYAISCNTTALDSFISDDYDGLNDLCCFFKDLFPYSKLLFIFFKSLRFCFNLSEALST